MLLSCEQGGGAGSMASWAVVLGVLVWRLALAVQRAPPDLVLYECNETSIRLAVKLDPLGTGRLLDPQRLHLGSCLYSSLAPRLGVLLFQHGLRDCGFSRLTSGATVEHFAELAYEPAPGSARHHASPFAERINCTDPRAGPLAPLATAPATGRLAASGALRFTVTLLNGGATVFFLGAPIRLEFAVQRGFHQPLRVFLDACTATPTPQLGRSPANYSVVANHGCLVDGKVASSRFLPRRAPEAIRLSLQAFDFAGAAPEIYLHCQVLAWDPRALADPARKACSFHRDTRRWELLDDPALSSACSCCDSRCPAAGSRRKRDLEGQGALVHAVVVGPLKIRRAPAGTGSAEWHANGSRAIQSHAGGKPGALPPPVGALLLEVAVIAAVSLGFCLYNGRHRWLCPRAHGPGDSWTEALVPAEPLASINADVA
ncbi:zona pellucida sperm-binding protein 3-like [Pelodiscus sinensis]|uniref:zona pellucida sperm-binding protein 3-like n=1 Tax=Pelodiscus sinensis TaxID=13735 RepID=UPI003F6BEF3E